MDGLGEHFGDIAILPQATSQVIHDYLVRHAWGGDPAVLRITQQPWWVDEHRPRRPHRQTAGTDCVSCHRDTERGIYGDPYRRP